MPIAPPVRGLMHVLNGAGLGGRTLRCISMALRLVVPFQACRPGEAGVHLSRYPWSRGASAHSVDQRLAGSATRSITPCAAVVSPTAGC
jgi:hypothetical protein